MNRRSLLTSPLSPHTPPSTIGALGPLFTAVYPEEFTRTAALLVEHGVDLKTVPTKELQKAEAGVTCRCIAWNSPA